jgi:hypothetical protein
VITEALANFPVTGLRRRQSAAWCGQTFHRGWPVPWRRLIDEAVLADPKSGTARRAVTTRAIEALKVGDRVVAWSEATGRYASGRVRKLFSHPSRASVIVTIKAGALTERIECTSDHPFWVAQRGWTPAKRLCAEDRLLAMVGVPTVVSVEHLPVPLTVHNIEVEEVHTYLVGRVGAVVHNRSELVDADLVSSHMPTRADVPVTWSLPGNVPVDVARWNREVLRRLPRPDGFAGHQVAQGLEIIDLLPPDPETPVSVNGRLESGLIVFPKTRQKDADGYRMVVDGGFKSGTADGDRFWLTNQPFSEYDGMITGLDPRQVLNEWLTIHLLNSSGYRFAEPGLPRWVYRPDSQQIHVGYPLPNAGRGANSVKPKTLAFDLMNIVDPAEPHIELGGVRYGPGGHGFDGTGVVIAVAAREPDIAADLLRQTERYAAPLADLYTSFTGVRTRNVARGLQGAPDNEWVGVDPQLMDFSEVMETDPHSAIQRGDDRFDDGVLTIDFLPLTHGPWAAVRSLFGRQIEIIAWMNDRRSMSFPSPR